MHNRVPKSKDSLVFSEQNCSSKEIFGPVRRMQMRCPNSPGYCNCRARGARDSYGMHFHSLPITPHRIWLMLLLFKSSSPYPFLLSNFPPPRILWSSQEQVADNGNDCINLPALCICTYFFKFSNFCSPLSVAKANHGRLFKYSALAIFRAMGQNFKFGYDL